MKGQCLELPDDACHYMLRHS